MCKRRVARAFLRPSMPVCDSNWKLHPPLLLFSYMEINRTSSLLSVMMWRHRNVVAFTNKLGATTKAARSTFRGYSTAHGNVQRPTIASVDTHTMGTSLHKYLEMKVHPDIKHESFKSIRVMGKHLRTPPARISSIEQARRSKSRVVRSRAAAIDQPTIRD